mmetsp:Transcript_18702/g.31872  ORF Transcript_18702/g.31872 Transcript_18702/m.31872 type:complete len:204 (+) Transcript_18702:895-1506(+)
MHQFEVYKSTSVANVPSYLARSHSEVYSEYKSEGDTHAIIEKSNPQQPTVGHRLLPDVALSDDLGFVKMLHLAVMLVCNIWLKRVAVMTDCRYDWHVGCVGYVGGGQKPLAASSLLATSSSCFRAAASSGQLRKVSTSCTSLVSKYTARDTAGRLAASSRISSVLLTATKPADTRSRATATQLSAPTTCTGRIRHQAISHLRH